MGIAKFYSPLGVAVVEFIKELPKSLFLVEVRPWYNPHPPERLTEQFQSLLMSEPEADPGFTSAQDAIPNTSAELNEVRAALEDVDPDGYTGNAYGRLIDHGLLPRGGTWGLVRGVARCTPDDQISNRTRWTLQMLLVRYWMKFGPPKLSDSFLYVWHDTAFQFAGQSRTIGKLAWSMMQAAPRVMSQRHASEAGCVAIYLTNQPDGTIPVLTVIPRMAIDAFSRLLYDQGSN